MTRRQRGWYPDPQGERALRWWDGKQWTHQTSDVSKSGQSTLAYWAYVFALFLPPVAVVLAVILFARGEVGPGLATLLLCFVGAAFGAYIALGL